MISIKEHAYTCELYHIRLNAKFSAVHMSGFTHLLFAVPRKQQIGSVHFYHFEENVGKRDFQNIENQKESF